MCKVTWFVDIAILKQQEVYSHVVAPLIQRDGQVQTGTSTGPVISYQENKGACRLMDNSCQRLGQIKNMSG